MKRRSFLAALVGLPLVKLIPASQPSGHMNGSYSFALTKIRNWDSYPPPTLETMNSGLYARIPKRQIPINARGIRIPFKDDGGKYRSLIIDADGTRIDT